MYLLTGRHPELERLGLIGEVMRLADTLPMFVLEMANNHMGDVDHGIRMLRTFRDATSEFPYPVAFKLQYRELDTFIHPRFRGDPDAPYVRRFEDTRLSRDEFKALRDEARRLGFISMCTPFDEASVDLIEEHDHDIVKIGSCSFTDWPLLERIALVDKPIIASTGGASLDEIDKVVSFLQHRGKDFALMHCVAEYPTATDSLELNQIDLLKDRYPGVIVGFSTHEHPADTSTVRMAIAKGATILEKHVGLPTEEVRLNAYSAGPDQVRSWMAAADEALRTCGIVGQRYEPSAAERRNLRSLRRGVFARHRLEAGHILQASDLMLSIPGTDGQLTANDLSKYVQYRLRQGIDELDAISVDHVEATDHRADVYAIIQDVKGLLRESGLAVPSMVDLEISHHYGLDRFASTGVTILNVVNREYCKKLLILLPGQAHPAHFHRQKEETFHVLHGEVILRLDDAEHALGVGQTATIERGVQHSFRTESGAVIDEISTTHHGSDSFYLDPGINNNGNRKTFITHWMA